MALFDNVCFKKDNFVGYIGDPPKNKKEYDAIKSDMFKGTPPTWETIKAEMDAYVDPRKSAKAKLIAGEPLTEEEANTIVL